jgi:hypothetical protein
MWDKILSWKLTPYVCLGFILGTISAYMEMNPFSAILFSVSGIIFMMVVFERIESLTAELKKKDINL